MSVAQANVGQQSQDEKIRVQIYGNWYLATVVGRHYEKLEYRLEEPVMVHVRRAPILGIIPRRPLEVKYLPKGHRRTINTKYHPERVAFA